MTDSLVDQLPPHIRLADLVLVTQEDRDEAPDGKTPVTVPGKRWAEMVQAAQDTIAAEDDG